MRLTLSAEQLSSLLPAHIRTDAALNLLTTGPTIAKAHPGLAMGSPLQEHFRLNEALDAGDLPLMARSGSFIHLQSRQGPLRLRGPVLATEHGYLLALHLVPPENPDDPDAWDISDFAPGDSAIATRVITGMHQQILAEAQVSARELHQARERTSALLEQTRLLAGRLAHELNNCLSIIQLNATRLSRAPALDAASHDQLATIQHTARRTAGITAALMALSHQPNDTPAIVEVDQLLASNKAYFQSLLPATLSLELALEANGARIRVSRNILLICAAYLLLNTSETHPDKGGASLHTRILAGPDGQPAEVELLVAGQAASITPETLTRVCVPLYSSRVIPGESDPVSLLQLARELGGQLAVITGPRGPCVSLRLPLATSDAPATPHPAGEAPDTAPTPLRVLLVEDEPFALEALQELIEADGHHVTPASDGQNALEALQQSRFDVLLSDVMMPRLSGLDLARYARSIDRELTIILMSGYVPEPGALQPDWVFIRKPLDGDELGKALLTASRRARPQPA